MPTLRAGVQRGTAHARMENDLGIGEQEKAIILSMLASDAAEKGGRPPTHPRFRSRCPLPL